MHLALSLVYYFKLHSKHILLLLYMFLQSNILIMRHLRILKYEREVKPER